jgi:hypothetical protein
MLRCINLCRYQDEACVVCNGNCEGWLYLTFTKLKKNKFTTFKFVRSKATLLGIDSHLTNLK